MSSQNPPPKSVDTVKLDHTLDVLIQRVNDIRSSLNRFLYKLDDEIEPLSWPSALDSFALMSSQLNTLQKILASDQMAKLKGFVFFPIHLNPERDQELEKLTQGRVLSFDHEIVPHYLRTKQELDVETKVSSIRDKANSLNNDATTKQLNPLTKACTNVLSTIKTKRDEWNNDENARRPQDTTSAKDTRALIAAISQGTGLQQQNVTEPSKTVPQPSSMSVQQHMSQPRAPIPTINMGSHAMRHAGPSMAMRPRMHPYAYRP